MIKHRLLFIGIFIAFGWNSTPDFIGEVLHYSAGFRIFPAGNATLSIQSDSLENEMVYLLTSTVRTNSFLSNFYIGMKLSVLGGIIGGIWGFFDGAIGGFLFAWLYNKFNS